MKRRWRDYDLSIVLNWQSEFLQLRAFGSHESRDGDDELKGMHTGIDERLARVEHGRVPQPIPAGERR